MEGGTCDLHCIVKGHANTNTAVNVQFLFEGNVTPPALVPRRLNGIGLTGEAHSTAQLLGSLQGERIHVLAFVPQP